MSISTVACCRTATILVFVSLVSVSIGEWEVYNEEDRPDVIRDENFLPVSKTRGKTLHKSTGSQKQTSIDSRNNDINKIAVSNNDKTKFKSQMDTPTLKGTDEGTDVFHLDGAILPETEEKDIPEAVNSKLGHGPKSIRTKHSDGDKEEQLGIILNGSDDDDNNKNNENNDKTNVVHFEQTIQGDTHKPTDTVVSTQKHNNIHRQKKIAKLRQLQHPEFTMGLSPDSPQEEQQQQQQQQQHQQQHMPLPQAPSEGIRPVRELLEYEPEVLGEASPQDASLDLTGVEEIFVREGEASLGAIGPDCPPESNRWDCLVLADDLQAFRKDRNLSGATGETGHHRVKRQSNGNEETTAPPTNADDDLFISGDGNALYPDTEDKSPSLALKNSFTFDNNGNSPFDENTFKDELQRQLEEKYANLTGFQSVNVDSVRINPDGTVEANVTLTLDSDPAEYSQLTNDEYLDSLSGELARIGEITNGDLNIDGRKIVTQTDPQDLKNQAASILDDPCSIDQCSLGFHRCQVIGDANNRQIKCEHKCETFETTRNCEHGATCELDRDYEPFCSCTKRWTGTYCQLPVKDNTLDEGEITGVAAGAAMLAAGVIGTACYMVLCRRRHKDPIFSHYSDEEGSGRFSNPSSRLSNFVIDRPKISVTPINTFSPQNADNLSRRSSSGNSAQAARPSRPRYSNA